LINHALTYQKSWSYSDDSFAGCFTYQGQFAEEDEETGYNAFEARLWDNRAARWMAPDPAGQYWSPYLGMGNSPMNGVDPDGEKWFTSADGNSQKWFEGWDAWKAWFSSDWKINQDFGNLYWFEQGELGYDEGWGYMIPEAKTFYDVSSGQQLGVYNGSTEITGSPWLVGGFFRGFGALKYLKSLKSLRAVRTSTSTARLSTSGVKLNTHLGQLEKYGQAGYKTLQNGRIRYYGNIAPASKSGKMIGRRVVREWNPSSGLKRTWMETLDGSGNIRIVRPQFGNTKGIHYGFDKYGNYIGSWK
jgi:RHS repeat-associated protein